MTDRAAISYYVALADSNGTPEVDVTQYVVGFQYRDREAGNDVLELTVDNSDLFNLNDPIFERGATLACSFSNGQSAAPLRLMVVKKVTGGRTLQVKAVGREGSLMDTETKSRVFVNRTRSEVVRIIAAEYGFLEPNIEETSEVFEEISQGNLTDAQLLRKLASLEGFQFFIDAQGLSWKERDVGQDPSREYTLFTSPLDGEIIDFNIENDVTRRPGKVKVKGRDPIAKEDIDVEASNTSDTERDVLSDVAGTLSGEEATLTIQKEVSYEKTVPSNVETVADAKKEAKGKYRKAAQGAVKMTLEMRGDPSLVAKTVIKLNGFGKRASGLYYIREIQHSLDASSGYNMSVKVITDGYQAKKKGPGDAPPGDAGTLNNIADALDKGSVAVYSGALVGEEAQLRLDSGEIDAIAAQAKKYASNIRTLAKTDPSQQKSQAAGSSAALRRLANRAKKAGSSELETAALNAASELDKLAAAKPGDIAQNGKKNRGAVRPSGVTARDGVDVDGQPIITYQDTKGRR